MNYVVYIASLSSGRNTATKARRVVLQKYINYYCLTLGERQLMVAGMGGMLGWEYDLVCVN
jgi:hypothetical protein